MLRLVMTGLDRLEVEDCSEPGSPARGEVLLEVAGSALGTTQLHILAGTTHPAPMPRILGHEISGVVRSVGEGVSDVTEGDRVIVNPLAGCGGCRQCLSGRESVCARRSFIGMESDGGWAGIVAIPGRQLFRIPPAMPILEAVMLSSAVPSAVHAVRRAGVRPGDRVAVLGLGSIGLLLCQVARAFGATTVVGGHGHRRTIAGWERYMDCCLDLSGADSDQAAVALNVALGEPADVVFEAAGTPGMLEASLRAVRTGGVVLAMGLIKGAHAIGFADYMHDFAMREIEIRTTYAYTREDFPPSIGMFAAGRVDVRPLIAGEVTPEEVPDLVARLRREGTGGKRHLIRF
jgi:threonine dehydrogenase-like Zn-dependent dehydrogenase